MAVWENVAEIQLSEILTWCLENERVDTLLITSRQSFGNSGKGEYEKGAERKTKNLLEKHLIERFEARGWPGTKLTNHKGRVYVSAFDTQLAKKMAKAENNLFKWSNVSRKALPEDVCLFRRGAKAPTLISIIHEREAWVIAETCPPGFTASSFSPEELYIWSGKYFCRI
ncbi:MAG TPA: hypothetical protein VFQ41_24680 [Candidatus Angelobacter sp.]|nr:hypothetical protein [Candidatus Angelobacter sp.]